MVFTALNDVDAAHTMGQTLLSFFDYEGRHDDAPMLKPALFVSAVGFPGVREARAVVGARDGCTSMPRPARNLPPVSKSSRRRSASWMRRTSTGSSPCLV